MLSPNVLLASREREPHAEIHRPRGHRRRCPHPDRSFLHARRRTYGLYEDEFSKLDGHWFIQKRNVLNEFLKGRNSGPNNPVRDMDALADATKK